MNTRRPASDPLRRGEDPETRVWIVAASAVRRARLESAIAADHSVAVVGRSDSLATVRHEIAEAPLEALLIELDAASVHRLGELLASLGAHAPAVVLLADPRGLFGVASAVRSGIRALLPLDASAAAIRAAITAAVAGLVAVHPALLEVFADLAPAPRPPDGVQEVPLTERELEVLALMAQGLGNKAIAENLGISDHTVKFHIGSIFNKLDVSSRTEAVAEGVRAGLIFL